jgi:uncharacterized protein YbbC (DUF1343 family)
VNKRTVSCFSEFYNNIARYLLVFIHVVGLAGCGLAQPRAVTGAEQIDQLLPVLKEKRIALVVNQTSLVGKTHLADTLLTYHVKIQKIFAPEHGFRGDAGAGEDIRDSVDAKTGIPVVSIYGKSMKPSPQQLADVDVLVFDIQDVGARFYTYISTLHYIMEEAAKAKKPVIVLDRPNPNGNYVDGPIRTKELKSFVGLDPLPVVYGLTIGELAEMINGEGWLEGGITCDLSVIKLRNWTHNDEYSLPIRPSPNLPNDQAIRLYPSLCLLEGTNISVGRGTLTPFQIAGSPETKTMPFEFMPASIKEMAPHPPHENKLCYGIDLRNAKVNRELDLKYVLEFYKAYPEKGKFFIGSFDRLAGTPELKEQIKKGWTEKQIKATWEKELDDFKMRRKKYLLYP